MLFKRYYLLIRTLLPFYFSSSQPSINGSSCKAVPDSPTWPSKAQWDALNSSISGQLLAPLPPAAVCDPAFSVYDNASCAYVTAEYGSSDFLAKDPISVDWPNWENDACLPDTHKCNPKLLPRYVVNATESVHVKAGVDFARERNVRLNVKGTGHDFLGRSTAPNSLSIWTHNIRGLQWHDAFAPRGCSAEAIPALTVAAGHRMFEIYAAAAAHNSMIIGGQDPDVGIGGYITGGGHSPISAQYGLAADNILELDVVTPSGDIKTLNQCSNMDLFFAFRGGGGATFGVILSATFKAVPMPSMAWSHFTVTQTNSDDTTFWQAMAYYHSQLPHLAKSGVMGYYNISNLIPGNASTPLQLAGGIWILNSSIAAFDAVFTPVLNHTSASYPVKAAHTTQFWSSYYDWWKVYSSPGLVALLDSQIGSRFLDEKALSTPISSLAESLRAAYNPLSVMIANLVSYPGVGTVKPPGGRGSMTPAWRTAIVEMIIAVSWTHLNVTAKTEQTALLTNTYLPVLHRLAPDTGCYSNEANPDEPNLPQAYWGANYPRLVSIKRQYDPEGVFWCGTLCG